MEAEFLIPLLRNDVLINKRCGIRNAVRRQSDPFISECNISLVYVDLNIRIPKHFEMLQRRNSDCKRLFNTQSTIITAGRAMTFHRPDMLVLEQNTLIFRSGAAQIYGILYLLDAFENVCRVCRIALLGFKLRPCRAFLSFINRELAALVSAAHGYDL